MYTTKTPEEIYDIAVDPDTTSTEALSLILNRYGTAAALNGHNSYSFLVRYILLHLNQEWAIKSADSQIIAHEYFNTYKWPQDRV